MEALLVRVVGVVVVGVVVLLGGGGVDAGHALLPGEAFNYHGGGGVGGGFGGVMLPTDGTSYDAPTAAGAYTGQGAALSELGYTTRGGHYGSPPPRGGYFQHHYEGPPCGHSAHHDDSSLMDALLHLGAAKLGMVGVVKGGVASLLSKLPWLLAKLALKLLLLKLLTLPLLLPLLIPLATAFLPHLADKFSCCGGDDDDDNNSTRSFARMAHRALAADRCFERSACELGALNAASRHNKPVLWALSAMMRSDEGAARLRSYKEAYVVGLTDGTCPTDVYPCDLNVLVRSITTAESQR